MATIKQIEANRLNAQKSTGPRSVEGKARSSQNALKSGIDAESLLIRGENRAALETLTEEYIERFHPTTPEQRHYVDTLIRDDWQIRRLAKVDSQIWEHELTSALKYSQTAPEGRAFSCASTTFFRLQRRIDSAERSSPRALRELHRLPSREAVAQVHDRRTPQNGLVPQKSAELLDLPIFSSASPSRDLTRALGPYTLTPAHLFK